MSNRTGLLDEVDALGVKHINGKPISRATVRELEDALTMWRPRQCPQCEGIHAPIVACAQLGLPLEFAGLADSQPEHGQGPKYRDEIAGLERGAYGGER